MSKFKTGLNYIELVTESSMKKVNRLSEAIEFYKKGEYDLEKDFITNLDKFSDLEPMEQLQLHSTMAKDTDFIKKIVKFHKDKDSEFKYYPYMLDILNELFKDTKNNDKVVKLISEISSSYADTINNLTELKMGQDLIKNIEECFILSPPYLNYLNSINKVPDDGNNEIINELNEYVEMFESLNIIINEVSVKDKATKIAVDMEKKSLAFANMINKIKEKYEEKAKMDKAEQIVKDSWNINKQLRRIIRSAPFAIVNPAIGLLVYVTLTAIDKTIDKKVRATYIGDLKLEIRLIEDKIAEAESKGDTKAKAQMIRDKDKLERALEKLQTGRA